MIGTDRYSYLSRLKRIDPVAKLVMSAVSVVFCLCANSIAVSAITIICFCMLSACKGGTAAAVFLRLLRAPLMFLLIGTATVLLGRFATWGEVLVGVRVGNWIYGVSPASLVMGARLIARALGCVASIYFTALSTPITDLLPALRRMHVPQLFLELMELTYRFIFILYETAGRIRVAQASRLGYQGLRRSYHSLGVLLGTVFIKAYRKSDTIYTSLEARGYAGELRTLPPLYESGRAVYFWCAGLTAAQIVVLIIGRGLSYL